MSDWYIKERDKWGFTQIYDGPFDSRQEAEQELERLEDRDGHEAVEDLFVQNGEFTKTSFYE